MQVIQPVAIPLDKPLTLGVRFDLSRNLFKPAQISPTVKIRLDRGAPTAISAVLSRARAQFTV
ncbi:hypothetical protein, partial [uncultured Gimesia sp.]|uniref:hypothetical protein n=1 Tax=uncultured Gimesia sp. TaxID=1678688 RepID=UPI0030DAC9A9